MLGDRIFVVISAICGLFGGWLFIRHLPAHALVMLVLWILVLVLYAEFRSAIGYNRVTYNTIKRQ